MTVRVGIGLTVIFPVAFTEQLFFVVVTVYVVVVAGEAVILAALTPVDHT